MVCLTKDPDLVLAIGQKLQRIKFVNNQSLNNSERICFLISVLFMLASGGERTPNSLGGVLFCQEASLASEVHLSVTHSSPPH